MMDDSMFYPREISECCRAASKQFPVILVTGTRQVGKTTLLQQLAEKQRRLVIGVQNGPTL